MTLSLFHLPPCTRCNGTGRERDRDGENVDCPRCNGASIEPAVCNLCDRIANGQGSYCDRHDPATADIPF